jgi:hypothetical protein
MRLDIKFILFFVTITYWYAMTFLFESVLIGGIVAAASLIIGWWVGQIIGKKQP